MILLYTKMLTLSSISTKVNIEKITRVRESGAKPLFSRAEGYFANVNLV